MDLGVTGDTCRLSPLVVPLGGGKQLMTTAERTGWGLRGVLTMDDLTPTHPTHPNTKTLSTHRHRKSLPKQTCTLCRYRKGWTNEH